LVVRRSWLILVRVRAIVLDDRDRCSTPGAGNVLDIRVVAGYTSSLAVWRDGRDIWKNRRLTCRPVSVLRIKG